MAGRKRGRPKKMNTASTERKTKKNQTALEILHAQTVSQTSSSSPQGECRGVQEPGWVSEALVFPLLPGWIGFCGTISLLPPEQSCPRGDGDGVDGDGCVDGDVGGINELMVINVLMVMWFGGGINGDWWWSLMGLGMGSVCGFSARSWGCCLLWAAALRMDHRDPSKHFGTMCGHLWSSVLMD